MNVIKSYIEESIAVKSALVSDENMMSTISEVASAITAAFKNGKKVLFCGNGGSAADAQHLASELSGRFFLDRKALPAEALHTNTSYLTAVANDYSFDVVYARLIEGIAEEGDVLIALSTSGNSANIVKAVEAANAKKMISIGMTGQSGGAIKGSVTYLINIPSANTPRIQECHILVGHIICQLVEEQYFKFQ